MRYRKSVALSCHLGVLACLGALWACLAVGTTGEASAAGRSLAPEFQAKVVYVDDGDTVVALLPDHSQTTVRLANIDAPEASHGHCRPGQPWSAQSTQMLKTLVLGKTITFRCHDVDRYDRQVCDLDAGQAETANIQLVRAGLAWANRANPRYLRDRAVATAEDLARANQRGLWSQPGQTPPWVWRQTEWKQQRGCI